MKHYQYVFFTATYLTYILYVLVYLGVWKNAPNYLNLLEYFFRIFVALVLIYFFHPFAKTTFTTFHRRVVFTAAIYLLTSTTFSVFLKQASEVKSRVMSNISSLGFSFTTSPPGSMFESPISNA